MNLQFFVTTGVMGRVDVTERVARYQFESLLPGGWWTAKVRLDAPRCVLWQLVDGWPGGELEVIGAGQTVWRGELAGARLSGNELVLLADGAARSLTVEELWRIFSDPEYGRWEPESDPVNGFTTDNNNRVWCAAGDGVTFTAGDEVSVVYPESGAELGAGIVRLQAHVVVTVTSGSWIAEIRDDDDNVLWSSVVAVEEDIDLEAGDVDELVAVLRATADGMGEATFRLTQVVVRTLDPAMSSDVIEMVLNDAGMAHQVDASGVDVARAVYQGKSDNALRAIQEMAELGDGTASWLFVVYDDAEGTPLAEFRAWADDNDPDWRLDVQDFEGELEWKRAAVVNAVRAELPDGWRSDWYVDTASVAKFGRREETRALPMTTRAEAETLAQVYLADHAWPVAGLRLDVGAHCRRPDGTLWPAWMVRAGDVVVLHDLIPDRDEMIRVVEAEVRERGIRIVPAGPDDRLETLLAAMEQRSPVVEETIVVSGGAGGDMYVVAYDTNADGVVNDADALGGVAAASYLTEAEHTAIENGAPHHGHTNKAELDLVTDGEHDVRIDNPHVVTAAQAGATSRANACRQSLVSTLWGTITAALTWTGAQIYQAAVIFQEVASVTATKATSLLTINQSGTGDIAEFQDGGNVAIRLPDGGGMVLVPQAGGTQNLAGLIYYDNTANGFKRLKLWHEEHNYPVPVDPRSGFRNVPIHTTFP